MKRRLFKIGGVILLGALLLIASLVLIPRNYDVLKFEERPGTKYWNLPTGSKIGYTFIKSNVDQKSTPIIYLHGGPGSRVADKVIEHLTPLSEIGFDLYFL